MKIIVFGEFYEDSFASHISMTLGNMGHQVENLSPFKARGKNNIISKSSIFKIISVLNRQFVESTRLARNFFLKRLLKNIKIMDPQLIICCYDYLWSEEIRKIKETSDTKIILWYPDALSNFGRAHFMNSDYDYLFFKDPYIVKRLRLVIDNKVFYLPECFNPLTHVESKGVDEKKFMCDICSAGNMHSYRVAFFKNLSDQDLDIKIWGLPAPTWLNASEADKFFTKEPVYNHEKASAFLNSKIVINNLHYAEIEGVNVRTFEIAGIGAFQIVDWRSGLGDLFVPGEEIETFRNMNELKEKIDYYLKNEALRNNIADNGKKRAYEDHTYEKRLSLLIDKEFNQSQGYNF